MRDNSNVSPCTDRQTDILAEVTSLLRHKPPLEMDGCGFVPLATLKDAAKNTKPFMDELLNILHQDEKQRFQLSNDTPGHVPGLVRATHGHTFRLNNPMLDPLKNPEQAEVAIHATSKENWRNIQNCGKLQSMSRSHIHFATQPRHLRMEDWASVLLRLDLRGAIDEGIEFWLSANKVLLSEGPIPLKYLSEVEVKELPQEWQGVCAPGR